MTAERRPFHVAWARRGETGSMTVMACNHWQAARTAAAWCGWQREGRVRRVGRSDGATRFYQQRQLRHAGAVVDFQVEAQ